MKDFLINLIKTVSQIVFSLLTPVILVVIGAMLVGYGIYKDWPWMTNRGVFLAVLGLMFIFRYWWFDEYWWFDD